MPDQPQGLTRGGRVTAAAVCGLRLPQRRCRLCLSCRGVAAACPAAHLHGAAPCSPCLPPSRRGLSAALPGHSSRPLWHLRVLHILTHQGPLSFARLYRQAREGRAWLPRSRGIPQGRAHLVPTPELPSAQGLPVAARGRAVRCLCPRHPPRPLEQRGGSEAVRLRVPAPGRPGCSSPVLCPPSQPLWSGSWVSRQPPSVPWVTWVWMTC